MTEQTSGASPEGTASAGHNVVNREKLMAASLSEMFVLDQKLDAANLKHCGPIRAQRRDIKKRLNKDLNVTAEVFNAKYGSYKVEARARLAEDTATLDTLREFSQISFDYLETAAEA